MKNLQRIIALGLVAGLAFMPARLASQTTPPPTPIPAGSEVDTGYVTYDEGPISLPLGVGFRIPAYNRVDGLVLPWGPLITFGEDMLELDLTGTYRSHIGEVDPFLKARLLVGGRGELIVAGGRSTLTNDQWIRSDLINSLAAIGVGSDARNYFRADRGTAEYQHEIIRPGWIITPSIGALYENAWSTGSPVRHTNAPWGVFGKSDTLKLRRANPAIARGHTASALGRVNLEYEQEEITGSFDGRVEHAFDAPSTFSSTGPALNADGDFTQLAFGAKVSFPTFGLQRFDFRGHAVFTPGDAAPPQRFAYLGGAGTLATVDLLAIGGDNLLFVEGEYSVPLRSPVLPFVGTPVLSARYAAGSAGVGELPDFIQNIGVGVGVRLLKAEYHIDPNYRKTPFTKRSAFSVGVSLSL